MEVVLIKSPRHQSLLLKRKAVSALWPCGRAARQGRSPAGQRRPPGPSGAGTRSPARPSHAGSVPALGGGHGAQCPCTACQRGEEPSGAAARSPSLPRPAPGTPRPAASGGLAPAPSSPPAGSGAPAALKAPAEAAPGGPCSGVPARRGHRYAPRARGAHRSQNQHQYRHQYQYRPQYRPQHQQRPKYRPQQQDRHRPRPVAGGSAPAPEPRERAGRSGGSRPRQHGLRPRQRRHGGSGAQELPALPAGRGAGSGLCWQSGQRQRPGGVPQPGRVTLSPGPVARQHASHRHWQNERARPLCP